VNESPHCLSCVNFPGIWIVPISSQSKVSEAEPVELRLRNQVWVSALGKDENIQSYNVLVIHLGYKITKFLPVTLHISEVFCYL
jgi:hypothetical protein